MVLDGTSTIEDYLYDAKQPQMAAQVKQEVDLIAKWRRQQRPLKSSEQNASTKTGDGLGISPSFADLPRTEPTQPKQTGPEIWGESLSKDGCGPYIDDQWRDILSGQGFQSRSETLQVSVFGEEGEESETEVWRSTNTDAMIQITTDEEGDPVWRCFINGRFVAEGDDSDKLLSLLETAQSELLAHSVVYFTCDLSLCEGVITTSGFSMGTR
jgi:hypothetical protein